MRTVTRSIAAVVLSVPLVFAGAGVAAADSGRSNVAGYQQSNATAGPDGAARHLILSGVDADGNAYFYEVQFYAGPDGAGSLGTTAVAGRDGAHFQQFHSHAGPYSAGSTHTSSSSGR
ncbi:MULTISPECIES: hypothetical protein [Actinokineospora]|uniref:hypothetical protein n=1 Tax=Actinokineospora TaxID=39845 RepID=UPI00166FEA6C|nr:MULTISPECIES: hypothetical protein [Actinokineospora]UVS79202.1 hypothetical protein Actkin_02948 [Actinokineospora sp. UTMC 2448]